MGILDATRSVFMRFYKNDTLDWWNGCVGDDVRAAVLSLNEEGLYKRACNWMYMTGEDLPGNDLIAAEILHINHNQYKAVVSSLIEKGKLIRAQGYVFNERVRTEREKYLLTSMGLERAAKKREQSKARRVEGAISAGILALKVSEMNGPKIENTQSVTIINTPPVIGYDPPSHLPEVSENTNEINDELESLYQTESTAVLQQKHSSAPTRVRGINRASADVGAHAPASAFHLPEKVVKESKKIPANPSIAVRPARATRPAWTPELALGFECFWEVYPRKIGKKDAAICWARALQGWTDAHGYRVEPVTIDGMVEAARRFAAAMKTKGTAPEYIPHASTWINGARHVEALHEAKAAVGERCWWENEDKVRSMTDADWRRLIPKHANGTWPIRQLGYPYGHQQSVVARSVAVAWRLEDIYDTNGIKRQGAVLPWEYAPTASERPLRGG